jgi:hypothetical protein
LDTYQNDRADHVRADPAVDARLGNSCRAIVEYNRFPYGRCDRGEHRVLVLLEVQIGQDRQVASPLVREMADQVFPQTTLQVL